jgi:hypothetical protein
MNYHNRCNSVLWDSGLGFGINVIPYLYHERDALHVTCKGLQHALTKHTDVWCADIPFQENTHADHLYDVNTPLPLGIIDFSAHVKSLTVNIKSCHSLFDHRHSFRHQFSHVYNCLYQFDHDIQLGLFFNQRQFNTISTNTLLVLVLLIMVFVYKHIDIGTCTKIMLQPYKMNSMEENIIRLIRILDKHVVLEHIQSFTHQEVRLNRYASLVLHAFYNSLSLEEHSLLTHFQWVD